MTSDEKNRNIKKRLKHEYVHLKPTQDDVKAEISLSNITLDYRHFTQWEQPYKLVLSIRCASVRVLVPKEWYVKVKGRISMTLLDNYTETYKQDKGQLELEIKSFGGKILVINELYA